MARPKEETPAPETPADARAAELARQADVEAAVAAAHRDELPTLGGELLEPGLGR